MFFLSKEDRKLKKGLVKCEKHFFETFTDRMIANKDASPQGVKELKKLYEREFTDIVKEEVGDFDDEIIEAFVVKCIEDYMSELLKQNK